MARLEFFFDCSSPWTYLAFHRIEDVCRETRAELVWRPILVGGVFNAVNASVYEQRSNPVPAKARYYAKDLRDWARSYGLRIGQPPVFPVNSVKAMRGAFFALERGVLPQYASKTARAYCGSTPRSIATNAPRIALTLFTGKTGGWPMRRPYERAQSRRSLA